MNTLKNKKQILAWIVAFCMVMPFLCPVLTLAEDYGTVLCVGEKEYFLAEAPTQNDLGVIVSAKVLAEAFSLEYTFDAENKSFEMYDDTHGTITLMHNATEFYSGGKTYKCAPFFYVSNGEPLVEIGFFCNMFGSSYVYDAENNKLIISKDKLSEDIAKVVYEDKVTALFIAPKETDTGLESELRGLAAAFDVSCVIDGDTAILTNQKGETVTLTDGATTFTSTFGQFECGSFFNIVNDIPMINVAFFCELYGICYSYDKETKTIVLSDEMTIEEMYEEQSNSMNMDASENYISGTVSYNQAAPKGGYNVKLILQQIGYRYSIYGTSSYYAGNSYVLGTVSVPEGAKSSTFSYSVTPYNTGSYRYYSMYYEESDYSHYGYYGSGGATSIDWSPCAYNYYSSGASRFSFYSNPTISLSIKAKRLEGTVSLADDHVAPEGGIDVNIMLQTRSSTYTDRYGNSYYDIGSTYWLDEVRIPYLSNSNDFSFDISYALDSSYYDYYSIFYNTDYNICTPEYGYLNTKGKVVSVDYINSYSRYSDAKAFSVSLVTNDITLELPVYSDYSSDFANKVLCDFTVGSTQAIINDEYVELEYAPIKYSSNVYVTPRECAEAIGATLEYNSSTKKYTFTKGGITYSPTSTYCRTVNGVTYIRIKQLFTKFLADDESCTTSCSSTNATATKRYQCVEVKINDDMIVPMVEAHSIDGNIIVAMYDINNKFKGIRTVPASQMVDVLFPVVSRGDYCKVMWWENGNAIKPVTTTEYIDLY